MKTLLTPSVGQTDRQDSTWSINTWFLINHNRINKNLLSVVILGFFFFTESQISVTPCHVLTATLTWTKRLHAWRTFCWLRKQIDSKWETLTVCELRGCKTPESKNISRCLRAGDGSFYNWQFAHWRVRPEWNASGHIWPVLLRMSPNTEECWVS